MVKAAAVYSLAVAAARRGGGGALGFALNHSDEVFAALHAALEAHSLSANDASFSENLYGLRRVGVPYIKAKLDAIYQARQGGALAAIGLTTVDDEDEDGVNNNHNDAQQRRGSTTTSQAGPGPSSLARLFGYVYPWIHAGYEGAFFAYQLLYLLEATPYFTPLLHTLRLTVVRASAEQLMAAARRKETFRLRALSAVSGSGPRLWRFLRRAWLRVGHATADYASSALIMSVLLFKVLEWWYSSGAEERVGAPAVLPVPPPPHAPKPAPDGVRLPPDPSRCPLCLRTRTNPALSAVSGYAFCYPCLFAYVQTHSRCPITLAPATLEDVRRLYTSAS
eukprot:jgi/Chlat1/8112/Chrsp75S00606